jgi:hypothetical protein
MNPTFQVEAIGLCILQAAQLLEPCFDTTLERQNRSLPTWAVWAAPLMFSWAV